MIKFRFSFFLIFLFIAKSFALDILDNSGKVILKSADTIDKGNLIFIAKDELIKILQTDKRLLFADSNSFCAINDKIYNLSYDCVIRNRKLYLPLKSFADVFNQHYGQKMLTIGDNTLVVNNKIIKTFKDNSKPIPATEIKKTAKPKSAHGNFNISNITLAEKKNGTCITLNTLRKFSTGEVSSSKISNGSFYLTIYKGSFDTAFTDSITLAGVVKKLSISKLEQSLQLNFELKREVLSRSIIIQKDKIILNLITEKASEVPDEALMQRLEKDKNRWKIDNIIIDPGHGGKDPGAIGKSGAYEKDIVLKIASYLNAMLIEDGRFKTVMTRDDDRFIPLKERTKIANFQNGKLFISIHCNANKKRQLSGFETYFLKPARTESAMEVAALENSVIKFEAEKENYKELTDRDYIVLSMMQANFAKESELWASRIQNQIAQFSEYADRNVDQAGFYVLVGASMPAVLVETGFISNPAEEKSLKSAKYQKQLAKAIYNSILELKEKIENHE